MQTSEAALSSESSGVAASVTAVFTNADQLAADPSSASLRQTFLQSVADVATAFNRSAKSLSDVAGNLADDATTMAAVVNTDLTALATVNTGLLRSTPNSSAQASLLDQRDQLLDEIGGKVGVSATFGVGGTVALKLAAPGTPDLLNGQQISPLHIITQADGTVSVLAGGNAVVPSGGALAGLQAAAADLAQRRSALDQLAVRFGAQVNAQQAAGVDLSGQPGALLYDVAGGTAATLGALKVTADQIAAADSSSTNGNMLAYANLRGTGGIEAGWALLVAGQSQATASANAQHAAASALNDAAQTARSLRSGVDLNQQAADLLRYQQAYQASAKVLQTAKETLQAILNIS
jgi:flagellar hook-associated protein 1 FlgK